MFVINLDEHIAVSFSRFLPSHSAEPASNMGLHGIAPHSVLVSHLSSL